MVKNPPANAGDVCLIPGSRRSPGEGNGKNPIVRGAWWATVQGVAEESDTAEHTTEKLSNIFSRLQGCMHSRGAVVSKLCVQEEAFRGPGIYF